jgi:hypothetical protein
MQQPARKGARCSDADEGQPAAPGPQPKAAVGLHPGFWRGYRPCCGGRAGAWSSSSYSNSAFKELDEFQVKLRRKTPVPRFFSVWSTGRSDGAFSAAAQPSLSAKAVPFAAPEASDEDLVYNLNQFAEDEAMAARWRDQQNLAMFQQQKQAELDANYAIARRNLELVCLNWQLQQEAEEVPAWL